MHYEANGAFWFKCACNPNKLTCDKKNDSIKAFRETVVFGRVSNDSETFALLEQQCTKLALTEQQEACRIWLRKRLPALQAAFVEDMQKFGVKFIC